MAQFGRPEADTYNGDGWVEDDGTSVNMYLEIDETVADDADYIKSPSAPTNDVYVCRLSDIEDPLVSTGHTVRIRMAKEAAGGSTITALVELRQGYVNESTLGTLICTVLAAQVLSETITTYTYNLTGGEIDAITNYADLYLRVRMNQS